MTAVQRPRLISWESETGLHNRGSVSFVENPNKDENKTDRPTTDVTLAVSFDVPAPVRLLFSLGFVTEFVERTMMEDLKRFRSVVLRDIRERQRLNRPPFEDVAPAVQKAIETLSKPV